MLQLLAGEQPQKAINNVFHSFHRPDIHTQNKRFLSIPERFAPLT
jgi:hypothetical protein